MRVYRFPFPRALLVILPLAAAALFLSHALWRQIQISVEALSPALFGRVVVVDPGHGGWDPGMLGVNRVREADVNLAVAKKLAEYCQQGGVRVVLTRAEDAALAESKTGDLAARVAVSEKSDAFISLHCNSYLGSSAERGAQVFYEAGNEAGQALAQQVQDQLKADLENTDRLPMAHPGAYLLRHRDGPAVIVEMGFLSNEEEAALLLDETYQWKIAWAVYQALNRYFREEAAG